MSEEIASVRGIPVGKDCVSPAAHTEFSTPVGLLEFIAHLRKLSGGKPAGFKLCVGNQVELLSIVKAMLETEIFPDFMTIDGAEGGTGAAPLEFSDHVGMPLYDALMFVHNALVGAGVRDKIRLAASAKQTSAVSIAAAMAVGADWCNSARGFMLSMGCIQARRCHTNTCPAGIATQSPSLQRALIPERKSERVFNYHKNTVGGLAELIAAAGLEHPSMLRPCHVWQRVSGSEVGSLDRLYDFLEPGQLVEGQAGVYLQRLWDMADAQQFAPSM